MNYRLLFYTTTMVLLLAGCGFFGASEEKAPILLADREAPLGWVYLRVYSDKTFEFESRGLERQGDIYAGVVDIKRDTLFFNYTDSVPRAGNVAVLKNGYVAYIRGEYPEALVISMNKLAK